MKCIIGFIIIAVALVHISTAGPVRKGMVYYQSQPYGNYYNPMANRAFLMQYASQPVRRQAVSAFASGKKISAGTYLKESESLEEEDQEQTQYESNDRRVQSVAEAYPAEQEESDSEVEVYREPSKPVKELKPLPENIPQEVPVEIPDQVKTPLHPQRRKKIPAPAQEAEDDEEEEEDYRPRKGSKSQSPINTYFPLHFGSNAGAAIAVANSYSTGKGGQAASRATAYGSPASSRKRTTS